MDEPTRKEIDGVTYELRLWGVDEHHHWQFVFMALMGRVGVLAGSPHAAAYLMAATFDRDLYSQLWATCRKYTYRIGVDEKGEPTLAQLEPLEVVKKVVTPAAAIVQLMNAHVELQYTDFFQRLPQLLGAGMASSGSKSPPA